MPDGVTSIDIGQIVAGLDSGAAHEATLRPPALRIARFQGNGNWHSHATVPETVLVWEGQFRVEYRDEAIDLTAGQVCVIPPGREHRGVSDAGAAIVLLQPVG